MNPKIQVCSIHHSLKTFNNQRMVQMKSRERGSRKKTYSFEGEDGRLKPASDFERDGGQLELGRDLLDLLPDAHVD